MRFEISDRSMTVFIIWVLLSVAAGVYAANKGRSGMGCFFLSLFLSPLVGFVVALAMRPQERKIAQARGMKQCPDCAEFVQPDAKICRFCRHEFSETPSETPRMTEGCECPKCGSKSTVMVEELAGADRWVCNSCGRKWRQPAAA